MRDGTDQVVVPCHGGGSGRGGGGGGGGGSDQVCAGLLFTDDGAVLIFEGVHRFCTFTPLLISLPPPPAGGGGGGGGVEWMYDVFLLQSGCVYVKDALLLQLIIFKTTTNNKNNSSSFLLQIFFSGRGGGGGHVCFPFSSIKVVVPRVLLRDNDETVRTYLTFRFPRTCISECCATLRCAQNP